MSEWTGVDTPAIGVHETAATYAEIVRPRFGRYQHWNGHFWGQIGSTPDEAMRFATHKTEYLPAYWRAIEEEFA